MLKNSILALSLLGCLLFSSNAFSQDSNIYANTDMQVEIQKPDTWQFEEQSKSPLTLFVRPPIEQEELKPYIHAVLVVASAPGMTSSESLPAMREQIWKGFLGDKYEKLKEESIIMANEPGKCLFFQLKQEDKSRKWEEYYIVKNNTLYLLQFMAPVNLLDIYRKDFDFIFNSLKLIQATEEEEPKTETPKLDITLDPSSNKVVFICNIDSESGEYLFLSSISAAAMLNNGKPVVIATNGRLSESARNFFALYPPGKAYILGSEHQGIEGEYIEDPSLLWDKSQRVVVSARDRTKAVMAAPLAAKLKCPLLFDDDKIGDRLERLKPENIITVGKINQDLMKFARMITTLNDAVEIASLFGNFDYVAVTNTYLDEDKPDRSYLLASALAAYHNGVVYPINEKVKFNFGILTEEIEEEGIKYLQGKIPLGQSEVKVKVPIRKEVIYPSTPHFDDPYLDIGDGNGFVLTKIGDLKIIDEVEYAFSMRMIGVLGITKFNDYQRENRVYLLAPNASSIQKELLSFYTKTSMPEHVAIVGNPDSMPFGYQRDPVYFDSTMHEQELATDNIYANTDEDDYLELSVGRIVAQDAYIGSVNIARMVNYSEMPGNWRKNALFIYPTSVKAEEKTGMPMVFSSFESLLKNMGLEMKHAGLQVKEFYRDEANLGAVYPYLQDQALIAYAQHSDASLWSFIMGDETKYLVSRWNKESEKLPSDIKILPYFNAPTLIIGLGCDSGGLDTGVEPEKAFLYGCFEKGAIGYIGNTRAGFPDTEEHAIKVMMNDIIYQGATAGEGFRNGKNYLLYLLKNHKPYQISIFKDYGLAYGREFHQLVYYGDPALKMEIPALTSAITKKIEESSKSALITIQPSEEIWQYEVMNMKVVGKGPEEYLKVTNSPGLTYSSTEWGDPTAIDNSPRVLPSVFIKYELPENHSGLSVSLEEGPEWCYQGYNVETLESGKTYLLSNIALVKYNQNDGKYEVAEKVTLKITW